MLRNSQFKGYKKFLLAGLFVAAVGVTARGQWMPVNGLYGGHIVQLATSQTKLFAEVSPVFAVYGTSDNGLTWSQEYESRLIGSIGSNVYAVSDSFGVAQLVYKWSDGGSSWIRLGIIPSTDSLVCIGGNDSILFIGSTSKIYRSIDRGITWKALYPFSPNDTTTQNLFIFGFSSVDSFVFAGISNFNVNSTKKSGILRSSDNGGHWILLDSTNDSLNVNCLFAGESKLYIGTNRGIFFSTDLGTTWKSRSAGIHSSDIYSIALIDSTLMTGSSNGFYISTDNGANWTSRSIGLPECGVTSACRLGAILFVGTVCNGVYSSIDSGLHWIHSSAIMTLESPLSFLDWGDTLYSVGENLEININGANVFRSWDSGMDWQATSGYLPGTLYSLQPPKSPIVSIGSNLYVGSYDLFTSSDSGSTWVSTSRGLPKDYISCLAVQGSNMFAGTLDSGVYVSKDSGITWVNANQGKMSSLGFATMLVLGYHLIAGAFYGGIYITSDGGKTWEELDSGMTDRQVIALAHAGPYVFAGTPSGVFRASDQSSELVWSRVGENGLPSLSLLISGGNTLFASIENGLFFSTDYGENWSSSDWNILNSNPILSLFASDNMLFLGLMSYGGDTTPTIWRRPLSDFGISSVSQPPAIQQTISSFPNPFPSNTQIFFTASEAGYADIAIVNALGTEVAKISSGELDTENHSFTWDASNFAPGNYWYVVRMSGYVQTLPMTILR